MNRIRPPRMVRTEHREQLLIISTALAGALTITLVIAGYLITPR